ncbi:MAG TPA: hypothetical protein VKB09_09725 [Thermomicrobiales bacterium]|nr:hypothetical protein [Thermomicrobiales bacterium]
MGEDQGNQAPGRRRGRPIPTSQLLSDGAGRFASIRRGLPSGGKGCLALIVALVLVLIVVSSLTAQVDASEACAVTRFGKVVSEAGPGLHAKIPIADKYHCFRTATTYCEILEDEFRSKAAEQDVLRAANLAQGEADAIALRGKAARENPEAISLNYLETLKTID